jgi:hypothetical protein
MSNCRSRLAPLRGVVFVALLAASTCLAVAGGLIAVGSAQASTLPTVSIAINASSITVGGTLQSGAVNVVSTATGVKEAGAILFLLKPGVSVAEFYAYLDAKGKKDINATAKYGSLVFDAEAESGHSSEAQTNLQPGQYIAAVGQGSGPPKVRTSFTVTAAKSPASLPTPQATIRSIEFGFLGPTTLHVGELVRFENEGYLVHMDIALQVKNMKTAKQVVKLLLAGKDKQAEKLAIGGVAFAGPLSSGAYQQETINAKPGVYVQACFMNAQDGREHTRLGQERIIKIVK